jgi:hypothetical protein
MTREPAPSFAAWTTDAKPVLTLMMAVLYSAQDATSRGPEAIHSSGDQLRAAANDAVRWIPAHRCPVAVLDVMLTGLALSYLEVAELMGCAGRSLRSVGEKDLDLQLMGLIGKLAIIWSVVRDHTDAEAAL